MPGCGTGLPANMNLSIIIPTLNETDAIADCLGRLQSLRAAGHEVIVSDGGSTDGTPTLAEALADQVLIGTAGRARQMNAGATVARGDSLLFLHADTRLPEHAVALIHTALRSRLWGRFDVDIAGTQRMLRVVAAMMNLRSRLSGIATGDQAIFVDRVAFNAVGGYPEQPLMEDIELSRRLKRLGPPACLRERATTSGRRWETYGVWRTILLMWRLRFDYWRGVPASSLERRYHAR